MVYTNSLCNTDIDESEIILNHSQRLIEEKLLKCCTDKVASEICIGAAELQRVSYWQFKSKIKRMCYENIWVYFDCALDAASDATIVDDFINSLQDMKPLVNGLELL